MTTDSEDESENASQLLLSLLDIIQFQNYRPPRTSETTRKYLNSHFSYNNMDQQVRVIEASFYFWENCCDGSQENKKSWNKDVPPESQLSNENEIILDYGFFNNEDNAIKFPTNMCPGCVSQQRLSKDCISNQCQGSSYRYFIKKNLSISQSRDIDVILFSLRERDEYILEAICWLPIPLFSCQTYKENRTASDGNDLNRRAISEAIKNISPTPILCCCCNRNTNDKDPVPYELRLIFYMTKFRIEYFYTVDNFHRSLLLSQIIALIFDSKFRYQSSCDICKLITLVYITNDQRTGANKTHLKSSCGTDQVVIKKMAKSYLNVDLLPFHCSYWNRQLCKQRFQALNPVDSFCRLNRQHLSAEFPSRYLSPDTDDGIVSKVQYLSNDLGVGKKTPKDYKSRHVRNAKAKQISNLEESEKLDGKKFKESEKLDHFKKINFCSHNSRNSFYDENNVRRMFIKRIKGRPLNFDNSATIPDELCIIRFYHNERVGDVVKTVESEGRTIVTTKNDSRVNPMIKLVNNGDIKIKDVAIANKNENQSSTTDDKKYSTIKKTKRSTKEMSESSAAKKTKTLERWKDDVGVRRMQTKSWTSRSKTFSPEVCFFVWTFVCEVLLLLAIRPDWRGKFGGQKVNKSALYHDTRKWKIPSNKLLRTNGPFWQFLFLLFVMIAATEAVCPLFCSCKWKGGKQTVECINKGLEKIPSDIDPGTQVLDMTGNPLGTISKDKFKEIGLTNLQRIYVTRCKLTLLDDAAFRGLSNLVELDLSNNELRSVPAASFQHLPSLMRLQLSYNPITRVKDGSFRGLGYLTSLELTSCNIEKVEPLAFQGLDRLEWLKIDANNLTTMPSGIMLPKSLHGVDIHNNPWRCDCNLRQLRQWLVQYNVPSSIEPKCMTPIRLRNRVIKEIISMDFACAPEMRPTSLFLDVIEGKNVSFECHVKATPEAEVFWKFNNLPLENSSFAFDETTSLYVFEDRDINNEKISHLRIEMVNEGHSGIFQCIAENEAGRAMSNFTLRVSTPPTEPAPEVPVKDNMVYIIAALIAGVVFVLMLLCVMTVKCCGHKRSTKNSEIGKPNLSKDNHHPKSNNMPKYIQMGKPAPKLNGILVDTPQISVIENSPYRTEPMGTTKINPDLISDGPEDRIKPVKKKVCIAGVEEVDASGNRTTRKLDDIEEESDDPHFDSNNLERSSDYDPNYATLNSVGMDEGHYTLTNLSPEQQVPHTNGYYDLRDFPRDAVLVDLKKRYSPVPTLDQSSLYASLRRPRHVASPLLVSDQKYPENFSHGSPYTTVESRYPQSKICDGNHSFYECCQPIPQTSTDYDTREPMGRIRGDGCSFDNILNSCGGQCCYNENHHHVMTPMQQQLFDNSLPENYRPLDGPPPPPPAGYGDSEDEVDEEVTNNWDDAVRLSPGTRVLYSPKESHYGDTVIDTNAVTNV